MRADPAHPGAAGATPGAPDFPSAALPDIVSDELDLLERLVPLHDQSIIELGCGPAELARRLLARFPGCRVIGLDVDARQLARNLASLAVPNLTFLKAGAQDIPFADGQFDLALMLKSLHHVPVPAMGRALAQVRRVLRPGGHLYVSEPVFGGALNEITRLFHDERAVRRAAREALRAAVEAGGWQEVAEHAFEAPVHFADFAAFEQRMIRVSFAVHRLDVATHAAVRARFEAHMTPSGAHFLRPMRVNLLRRCD